MPSTIDIRRRDVRSSPSASKSCDVGDISTVYTECSRRIQPTRRIHEIVYTNDPGRNTSSRSDAGLQTPGRSLASGWSISARSP